MSGTCIDYSCLGSGRAAVDNLEYSLNSLKTSAGDVRSFPPEYPGMLMTAVSEVADAVDSISTAEIQTLQQKVSETVKLATNPALGFGYNEQVAFEQGYNSYNNVYNDIKNGGNAYDIQRLYDYNQEISTKNALEYYSKKNIQGTLTEKEKEAYTQLQKEYKWATKNSYNDNYNRELAAAQARMTQTDGKSYTQQSEDRKSVYNLKEKMGIQMSDAEREMLQSGAVEIFFEPVETAVASALEGVLGVVENIGDGAFTILGGIASYHPLVKGAEMVYNFLTGEDADFTKSIQNGVQNIVSWHIAEDLYDAYVDWSGIPDNVAYGKIHSIVQTVSTIGSYIALGFIPGGQIVGGVISGFAAAGDAAQTAFDNGATFDQAFLSSLAAGAAGAVAGNVLDKSKNVALSAGVAAAEPFVNSVVQYYTYAGDMVDGRGNKQYSGFWDYYGKSGGLTSSVMAGIIGGTTTKIKTAEKGSKYIKTEDMGEFDPHNFTKGRNYYKETVEEVEEEILKKYNNTHTKKYSDYSELKKAEPIYVKESVYQHYTDNVIDSKMWNYDYNKPDGFSKLKAELAERKAKAKYERLYDDDTWNSLSDKEKRRRVKSAESKLGRDDIIEYYNDKKVEARAVANNTIAKIENDIKVGNMKDGITSDDVVKCMYTDTAQSNFYTEKYIREYYKEFKPDKNGNVKVCVFQAGESGANNYTKFHGNIGAADGLFVLPEDQARDLIRKYTKSDGTIDAVALGKDGLGGVPLKNDIILITQDVNISDLRMPTGGMNSAYPGDFMMGGHNTTTTEGVIKQSHYNNSDVQVEVVQGSTSTAEYNQRVREGIEKEINGINDGSITKVPSPYEKDCKDINSYKKYLEKQLKKVS